MGCDLIKERERAQRMSEIKTKAVGFLLSKPEQPRV